MKVAELIALLEEQAPDAEVLIMSQPGWPLEYAVCGLALRSEFDDAEDEDSRENGARADRSANDVFIVEGTQLRYGSKRAWDVAAR